MTRARLLPCPRWIHRNGRRPAGGSSSWSWIWMDGGRWMHRENRLPQGREHGAVTPRAREPKRLWPWPLPLPATTARARLHGSQIQMARGAARREPWPQSWSLLGPSIVPAARAANNLMRVPCVRDRSATDVPVWPCACTRGAEALPCLASPGRGSVPAASARPSLSGVGPARRGCCHMG